MCKFHPIYTLGDTWIIQQVSFRHILCHLICPMCMYSELYIHIHFSYFTFMISGGIMPPLTFFLFFNLIDNIQEGVILIVMGEPPLMIFITLLVRVLKDLSVPLRSY